MKGLCTVGSNATHQKLNHSPEVNPDVNLTAVVGEISARWKSLSKEDRIAITTGSMQEIEEECEVRDLAQHKVPLKAFHDARSTVQAVEKEVRSILSDCRIVEHRSINSHSYHNYMQEQGLSSCSSPVDPAPRIS